MTPNVTKAGGAIPLDREGWSENTNIESKVTIDEPREAAVIDPSDDEDNITPSSKSSSSGFPVVFVGFGNGAHSLLSLGERGLLSALGADCDHRRDDGQRDSSLKPSSLASALARRGLHVAALILVNGFVSLEDRSSQARSIHAIIQSQ